MQSECRNWPQGFDGQTKQTIVVRPGKILESSQGNIETTSEAQLLEAEPITRQNADSPQLQTTSSCSVILETKTLPSNPTSQSHQGMAPPSDDPLDETHFPLPEDGRQRSLRSFFSLRRRENRGAVDEREGTSPSQHTASGWLRSAINTRFRRAQQCTHDHNSDASQTVTEIPRIDSPIPRIAIERPNLLYHPNGGAAARAAAAAQNGTFEPSRNKLLAEPVDSGLTKDSESGIGMEIRERLEDAADDAVVVKRKDPSTVLPEELLAHIFSYLDAISLVNTEMVSRRWYRTASAHDSWKHVFRREFGGPLPSEHPQTLSVGGAGQGKKGTEKKWKNMWKARKMLQARWERGHAAAIYLDGHKDNVYCVQFDEHKILTGSRDRTIRVWDAHTYQCIKVLGLPKRNGPVLKVQPLIDNTDCGSKPFASVHPPQPMLQSNTLDDPQIYHSGSVLCLQFDQDIMVTGSSDCSCIVWDLKDDYRPVQRLHQHTAGVLDVCFDDRYIISCSKDTTICVWNRKTSEFLRKLVGHRGPVNAVQLRGDLVVSASGDGTAKLWNLTSGLCIKEFPSKHRGMACVEFSPDSRTILAGGNDQVIYHFDANTGELVRELKGHKGLVRSLHLDSANGRVISGSYDFSVKAYDVETGRMICDFEGWTTSWMLSAKADYRRIIATSQDSRVVVMDFGYQLPDIELLEG